MAERLKILMSAYACEPGKGSEPEVGWQWATQMARLHDVTVLTRANNRHTIEKALADHPSSGASPRFVFHDEPPGILGLKRLFRAPRLYYRLWQRSARRVIKNQLRRERFDLLHHTTFASFRYPIAIAGHGLPAIWGPVGGVESIPAPLLPWRHPGELTAEVCRNLTNLIHSKSWTAAARFARQCSLTLASTQQMADVLKSWDVPTRLMPTIGLETSTFAALNRAPHSGPLNLLFVGNFIPWKGFELGIEALGRSRTTATYTLIGDGPFTPEARRLARRLGIENRVEIRGRIPRSEVLAAYNHFDALLFPSLHDSGGYAVIEAMCFGLPVICMDIGGPQMSVREDCGVRVAPGPRSAVIDQLAAAIRAYDQDRSRMIQQGRNARESVVKHYDWSAKAAEMDALYREVAGARS